MNGKILLWSTGFVVLVTTIGFGFWRQTHDDTDLPPLAGSMEQFKANTAPIALPDIQFLDADGQKTTLSALHGKLLVLNLWATWCAPCVEEMPSLDALDVKRQDARFAVVTISEDTTDAAQKVTRFFESHGIKALPRYLDPGFAVGPALKVAGLPTTLIVSPDGTELGRLEGNADWASPDALRLVDWYLDKVAKPQR